MIKIDIDTCTDVQYIDLIVYFVQVRGLVKDRQSLKAQWVLSD